MTYRLLPAMLATACIILFPVSNSHAQIFDPDANRLQELKDMTKQASIDHGLGKLEQRLAGLMGKSLGIKHFQIDTWDMWTPENSNLLNIRLTGENAKLHTVKQRKARKACADSLRVIKEKLADIEEAFIPANLDDGKAGTLRKFIRSYSNIDLSLEDKSGRERARCNSYFGTSRISYRKNRS